MKKHKNPPRQPDKRARGNNKVRHHGSGKFKAHHTPPPPITSVLPCGVYLDRNNYAALVVRVTDNDTAMYIALGDTDQEYGVHLATVERFKRRFINHLPAYPVRRCVRIWHEGLLRRSADAQRVFDHVLRSAA